MVRLRHLTLSLLIATSVAGTSVAGNEMTTVFSAFEDTGRDYCVVQVTGYHHNIDCDPKVRERTPELCSPDKKYSATQLHFDIDLNDTDPEGHYRFKYFTPEQCASKIRPVVGPNTHWQVDSCQLQPNRRGFEAKVRGWTYPQSIMVCLPLQDRIPSEQEQYIDAVPPICDKVETKWNHNVRCFRKNKCDLCSPDGEYCASRRTISLTIDRPDDPAETFRFKPLSHAECKKLIVGPASHWDLESCLFTSPNGQTLEATVYGFSKRQTFKLCYPIQEKVRPPATTKSTRP